MKLSFPNYLIVSIILIAVIGYILVDRYIDTKTQTARVSIEETIAEQQKRLVNTADMTKQIKSDERIKTYLSDCEPAKRDRFDVLLDKLSVTITGAELDELSVLFYQCGSYFSDVKSTMAGKLSREVEILVDYVSLQGKITATDESQSRRVEMWRKVADAEQKNAAFFADLVTYQEQIIEALRNGKLASSPEVVEIAKKAQTTREQMLVLNQQIDSYRKEAI